MSFADNLIELRKLNNLSQPSSPVMAGGSAVVISVSGGNLPHFGLDQESAIKMKKLLNLTRAVVLTGVILDNYP